MKTVSTALKFLIETSTKFYMADLYTIILTNGTTIHYTDHDTDLTIDTTVFKSMSISRGDITESVGISVDELDVTLQFRADDKIPGGATIAQALRTGAFDGAWVHLHRLFSPTKWTYNMPSISSDYILVRFIGRMDIDEIKLGYAAIKVKSITELLNVKLPKNIVMPSCAHTVFKEGCLLNEATYTTTSVVITGSTTSIIKTNLTNANGYFDQGVILFSSGANTNVKRSIKLFENGVVKLSLPLPFVPQAGDSFTVRPGCARTMSACSGKFNNLIHFRGFPFVPVPETSI